MPLCTTLAIISPSAVTSINFFIWLDKFLLCVRREIACQKHQHRGDRCAFVTGNRHAAAGALGDDDVRQRAGKDTGSNFRRQSHVFSPSLFSRHF